MARLLNTYQLWLDDLFPKAKFMDGVSMIEKLGHKKRIQMMRREWIEEGKPKPPRDEEDDFIIPNEDAALDAQSSRNTEDQPADKGQRQEGQSSGGASGGNLQDLFGENDEPDEDDLDALLAENENAPPTASSKPAQPLEDQEPDQDELDALLAEEAQNGNAPKTLFGGPTASTSVTSQSPPDNFDDDEEAMAGMDW